MKKHLLLTTAVLLGLVGCTDEQFGGQNVQKADGSLAIKMGTGSTQPFTRAPWTGSEAANRLGKNFIVEGFKSEGQAEDAPTATLTNPVEVFRYYNVNYYENTAFSTESNTHNWEYVGQAPVAISTSENPYEEFVLGTGFTPVKNQTIKYWDTDYARYDFVAFSRGEGATPAEEGSDPTYAQFSAVNKENIGKAVKPATGSDPTPVYTIQGSNAEIGAAYVADLVTVFDGETEHYKKANPVTPLFRKVAAKVRMAIYETVPGYSVKDVRFYQTASEDETDGKKTQTKDDIYPTSGGNGSLSTTPTLIAVGAETASTDSDPFKTDVKAFPKQNGSGTLSVFYPVICNQKTDLESVEGCNKAVVTYAPAEDGLETTLSFGDLKYTSKESAEKAPDNVFLGRTSNTATYAGATDESTESAYIDVIPTGTSHVLKLRVAYTLVPIDGGDEVIVMEDATAIVPAIYTNWQSNYAYTYIFKISEKSGDGLYPITFDALVMNDEDGIQETITKVSKPSITTYQKGKVVTENDEYVTGDPIYVTVDNGTTLYMDTEESSEASKGNTEGFVQLFTATTSGTIETITEATAENCFINGTVNSTNGTFALTDAKGGTYTLTKATEMSVVDKIEKDDAPHGLTITTSAAKFTPTAGGTYVFQTLTKIGDYTQVTEGNLHEGVTYYDKTYARISLEADQLSTDLSKFYTMTPETDPEYTQAATGSKYALSSGIKYYNKEGESPNETYTPVVGLKDGDDVSSYYIMTKAAQPAVYTKVEPNTFYEGEKIFTDENAYTDAKAYYKLENGTYTKVQFSELNQGHQVTTGEVYQTQTTAPEYMYKVIKVVGSSSSSSAKKNR